MHIAFLCLPMTLGVIDPLDPEQPLQGSLRDPWGVLSSTSADHSSTPDRKASAPDVRPPSEQFGLSFADVRSGYQPSFDLSHLGDTPADRFDRAVADWDQLKLDPRDWPFGEGMIVYGDPGKFVLPENFKPTIHRNGGWWISIGLTLMLFLLLLRAYRSRPTATD